MPKYFAERTDDLVSVVMPCYNAGRHLKEAIGSVLTQTYPAWELLIVDDGSTDESYEIVSSFAAQYPSQIRCLRQQNCGQWAARNAALRTSSGEFITCLDADDYWREDFLERMVDPLKRGEADITYCGWQNFGNKAPGGHAYIPPAYEQADPVRSFLLACPWPIHAAISKWKIFEALDGFSERHLRSMDYDFWLRTLTLTARYRLVPQVMAFYRWEGQGQMSDSKAIQTLNTQEIRERFVQTYPYLVAHIPAEERRELMVTQAKRKGYELYWAGELKDARHLFWVLFTRRALSLKDFRYAALSLLPGEAKDCLGKLRANIIKAHPGFKKL